MKSKNRDARFGILFALALWPALHAINAHSALAADDPPANAQDKAVTISVVDFKTNKPIPEFRVIAGVKFEEREKVDVVSWQPHTVRIGKDGKYVQSLAVDKSYDPMALRV